MLVQSRSTPEDIVCTMQIPGWYVTAHQSRAHQSRAAELLSQRYLVPIQFQDKIEQPMEVPNRVVFHFLLQSLLVYEVKHTRVTPRKKAIMQDIEEELDKAFELGFQATINGIKSAFIFRLEMSLMNMIQEGTLKPHC